MFGWKLLSILPLLYWRPLVEGPSMSFRLRLLLKGCFIVLELYVVTIRLFSKRLFLLRQFLFLITYLATFSRHITSFNQPVFRYVNLFACWKSHQISLLTYLCYINKCMLYCGFFYELFFSPQNQTLLQFLSRDITQALQAFW